MLCHLARRWLGNRGRWALIAVPIWLTVLTFADPLGGLRFLYRMAHYLLLPAAFAFAALSWASKPRKYALSISNLVDLSMVMYLVLVVLSVLMKADSTGGILSDLILIYRRILVPFLAYWLIRMVRPEERDLERIVPLFIILCIAECAAGMLAWFCPDLLPGIWPGRVEEHGGPRITGTFGQADAYAGSLVLFSTIILHDAVHRRRGLLRGLQIALFCISMFCVFLSFSRASWVAVMFVLVILLMGFGRYARRLILPAAGVVGLLLILNIGHIGDYALSRLLAGVTARNRIVLINAGIRMFAEEPLLGWGYGTYEEHDFKFITSVGPFEPTQWERERASSHNTYLTILCETGVLGFLLYTFPIWWWMVMTVKTRPRSPRSPPANGFLNWRFLIVLWANVFFILIICHLIDIRFFPFTLGVLWLIMGFIANLVECRETSGESRPLV